MLSDSKIGELVLLCNNWDVSYDFTHELVRWATKELPDSEEIAKLKTRLEIMEDDPNLPDGIECRDETIRGLDEKVNLLQEKIKQMKSTMQEVLDIAEESGTMTHKKLEKMYAPFTKSTKMTAIDDVIEDFLIDESNETIGINAEDFQKYLAEHGYQIVEKAPPPPVNPYIDEEDGTDWSFLDRVLSGRGRGR